MVVEPIEEEIRELGARLAAADRSELPEVAAELRAALKRHADQLRLITENNKRISTLEVESGGLRGGP